MRCTIETRDFGTMVFTLYPEYAPLTVANFVKTARSGFYDGLCWCRIVKDYVIQGGNSGAGAETRTKKPSSTRKYICPKCSNSCRATKVINLICGDCMEKMVVAE